MLTLQQNAIWINGVLAPLVTVMAVDFIATAPTVLAASLTSADVQSGLMIAV